MKNLLAIHDLKQLSTINPYLSTFHIAKEWLGIVAAVIVCQYWWHWSLYLLAVMWIGARMHALGILGHDGTHYLLYKNRKINDFITRWLLFAPLQFSLKQYRKIHFAHHQHLKTNQDPEHLNLQTYEEYQFPKTRASIYLLLIKDAIGYNSFIYFLKKMRYRLREPLLFLQKTLKQPQKIIIYTTIGSVLWYIGWLDEWFLYWLVPLNTWLALCTRLRVVGEHEALHDDALAQTRNVVTNSLEYWFLVPNHHSMHLVHHLYPSIPTYRLMTCHHLLLQNEIYRQKAVNTNGYWNMIEECVQFDG